LETGLLKQDLDAITLDEAFGQQLVSIMRTRASPSTTSR
jgi:hypothetical protein